MISHSVEEYRGAAARSGLYFTRGTLASTVLITS
jgi:hypothetical protein